MSKNGLFIVIDGPSASGKNTIIKQVFKALDQLGINALIVEETKEKTYDRRRILEARRNGDKEATKAIIEERKKLYQTKIIPQLALGTLVIANRGESTTLAYQTLSQELTMKNVWAMHRQQQIPLPDLVVITNCSVEEAIRREKLRKQSIEEKNKNWMSGKFTLVRKEIHANYEIVKNFLEKKAIPVIYLQTDKISVSQGSYKIIDFIKNRVK